LGEIDALLHREGIYSSFLSTWRKKRAAIEQAAFEPQRRGRKADPALAEARRLDQLTRENDRLRRQLAQARRPDRGLVLRSITYFINSNMAGSCCARSDRHCISI
jgi:hypothetical protein